MKFKKLFIVTVLLACFYSKLIAQAEYIGAADQLPSHPRILLLKGQEEIIKKTISGDKLWGNIQQVIINESDKMLLLPPVERIQIGRRLLDKSREALRRIFFLSYVYRTTGNTKYLQRAEKEMLAVAAFSDWNPSHFLDVAEMTMAISIGYDWLYNDLSPQSRTIIKEAIIKKGIEPSLDAKNNGWLKAENNWNQVCNAGMTYGALAIYEDNPALAKQIINRAIQTVVFSMQDFGTDGAYPEGYNYWGYGTSFTVMLVSSLDKAFGKNFGLSDVAGFLKTPYYMENMTGSFGKPFNYSDAGTGASIQPAMFWFAQKNADPSLLWVERNRLLQENVKKITDERLLPAMMLWGGETSVSNVPPPKTNMWVGKGKNPVALMRTSWTDSAAIFVGFKGGSVSVSHAHMDIGSFVMDADGERWAMDLGMQEYESLESKGMQIFGRTQDAQRWTVFRYTNQAHNTITVNDQQQRVEGYAALTSYAATKNFMNAVTDMSEVYKGQLVKAKRGVAIIDQKYVIVRDELEAADTVATIRWSFITPANVSITGKNSAELSRNGKKLLLRVDVPGANIVMKTWPTDPPPHEYDAPNPGTISVGFEVTIPAKSKIALNVFLIPEKAFSSVNKKIEPFQNWK